MFDVTKIVKQACTSCDGTGKRRDDSGRCPACGGTGTRFVPEGYTQEQVTVVRHLVAALAVSRGVA